MKRAVRYLKNSFFSIFLIGLLVGVICLMLHIILSGIVSEKFKFKYSAVTKIVMEGRDSSVTQQYLEGLIDTVDVKEQMKIYFGSNLTYDEFKKNYKLGLEGDNLTVEFLNENEDRAKRYANRLGNVLCGELISQDKIHKYKKIGVTESERLKTYKHNIITKLPITLFVEGGILAGMLLGFIILGIAYLVNGTIKSEKDIEDELNIIVLATIPSIKELSEVN